MTTQISTYDLGRNSIVEYAQAIDINRIVKVAKERYKLALVEAQIEAVGTKVAICTTKTRFMGTRLWFICPQCNKRKGKLYSFKSVVACRQCCGLKYKDQRYKGMCESQFAKK